MLGNGESKLIQTFYSPDGKTWQTGHRSTTTEKYLSFVSYRVENSNWFENRAYHWEKKLDM